MGYKSVNQSCLNGYKLINNTLNDNVNKNANVDIHHNKLVQSILMCFLFNSRESFLKYIHVLYLYSAKLKKLYFILKFSSGNEIFFSNRKAY